VDDKISTIRGEFIQPPGPEMFTLKMIAGSRSALNDQHSILLSKSAAIAFFGDENALEKSLKIDNNMEVKVAGIYEDLPHNSHFYGVKFFAPWDLLTFVSSWIKGQGFTNNFLDIYVELEDGVDVTSASHRIKNAILDNIRDDKNYTAVNPQIFLHPMKKWHLWADWKNTVNSGLIQMVWLFGIVGVFVLMLACINFMNLSTARSEKRAKEVGIRKAVGSRRAQLVGQFFSESFLVVLLAFISAIIIVTMSLPQFNELAGKQMEMPLGNLYFWMSCLTFIVFTGLLAGSYPALYLSSFSSIRALKGSLRIGRFASAPRKVLVVVQFTVSVTLIIGTMIVYKQIQFAKDRPVGYDRNGLIMIQMNAPDYRGKFEVLRTELKNTGVVTDLVACSSPVTDIWNSNGGFTWKGQDPTYIAEMATFTVTPEYGKTLGWQFAGGRDFSRDLASDSAAFVINEAAAKVFGFDNPIGEVVQWQSWWTHGRKDFAVIGVIKDQVLTSPYASPMPAVYFLGGSPNWLTFRIDPKTNAAEALPKIEAVFKKIVPAAPFDYKFVDQEYALKFAAEERVGVLALLFAVLAIFISCLGLFGLASFVAEQRTKEIGIRKVVGASVFHLWRMLSKDFIVLVILSCLVAIPLAYHFLTEWLAKYAYRTDLPWWIFALSSIGAVTITLATVSYQAIKAALANPVKSLRSE
jgi:ABC-type antimicrobial peptide transport system permease subunit